MHPSFAFPPNLRGRKRELSPMAITARWDTCPFCTLAEVGSMWSQLGTCLCGSPARCTLCCT